MLLGWLIGSAAWDATTEIARRTRSRPAVWRRGSSAGIQPTIAQDLAVERRAMMRLARRVRAYEDGWKEVGRAARAIRGRRPERDLPRPRLRSPQRIRLDRPGLTPLHASSPGEALRMVRRASSSYVLVTSATLPEGGAEQLLGALEASPDVGALAARVRSDADGSVLDGSWELEWSCGALHPRPAGSTTDHAHTSDTPMVGGSCLLLRREAIAQCNTHASYEGPLWGVDLSLELRARGWRVALSPVTAILHRPNDESQVRDVELLRSRWGGYLGAVIQDDLVNGGGAWCPRGARVRATSEVPSHVRNACSEAGWQVVTDPSETADFLLGLDASGKQLTAALCSPGLPEPVTLAPVPPTDEEPGKAARRMRQALASSLERTSIAIRIAAPDRASAERGGDLQLARSLARELACRGHHSVVRTKIDDRPPAGATPGVRLVLRGRAAVRTNPGQLNVLWMISHPDEVDACELDAYDRVLVASRPYVSRVGATTGVGVECLLQFTDPALFGGDAPCEKMRDLLFVGNWRGVYRRIVWDAHCTGRRVMLVGEGWRYLAPGDTLAEHVPYQDLKALYASARILLIDHWDDMRDHGFISNKVFDALASGSFVVCDDVSGLRELLPGGIETYRDLEELDRLLKRYLADPKAQRAVAVRGRELVLAKHTVERRVDDLLGSMHGAARNGLRPAIRHLEASFEPGQPAVRQNPAEADASSP